MKTKLRFLSFIFCTALFFTACGGGEGDEQETTSDTVATDDEGNPITSESEIETTTEDPNAPKKVKVGFIYSSSVGSDTLVEIFEKARYEVARNQGVETCYIENVLVQQFPEAVQKLKDDGCNFIVAASSHFAVACEIAAKEDEDDEIVYMNFGGSSSTGNMATFRPGLYQPVNVSGIVAAYNTVSNKIGMVVDNNAFNARGIANAFALGVDELPNAKIDLSLRWALSDSFTDTKKSIDELVKNGCDVIFLYQTTEYGIRYCEDIGVKVIGFSHNTPDIAPEQYLTGFGLKVDSYITELVRAEQYKNFRGGMTEKGLKYGYVSLIALNENLVKEGTKDISDSLYSIVYDERSTVFQGEIRDVTDTVRVDKGSKLSIDEIYEIDWVINKITDIKSISGPRTDIDLVFSDLEIRT